MEKLLTDPSILYQLFESLPGNSSTAVINESWIENQLKNNLPTIKDEECIKSLSIELNDLIQQMSDEHEDLKRWKKKGMTTIYWLKNKLLSCLKKQKTPYGDVISTENNLIEDFNQKASNILGGDKTEVIKKESEDTNLNDSTAEQALSNISNLLISNSFAAISENANSEETEQTSEYTSSKAKALIRANKTAFKKVLATAITIDQFKNSIKQKKDDIKSNISSLIENTAICKKLTSLNNKLQQRYLMKKEDAEHMTFCSSVSSTSHIATNMVAVADKLSQKTNEDKEAYQQSTDNTVKSQNTDELNKDKKNDIDECVDDVSDTIKEIVAEYADSTASATSAVVNKACEAVGSKIGGYVGAFVGSFVSVIIPSAANLVIPVCKKVGGMLGAKVGKACGKVINEVAKAGTKIVHKVIDTVGSAVKSVGHAVVSGVKSCCAAIGEFFSSLF